VLCKLNDDDDGDDDEFVNLSSSLLNERVDMDVAVFNVSLDVVVIGDAGRGEDDAAVLRRLEVDRDVVGVSDECRTFVELEVLDDVVMERHQRSVCMHNNSRIECCKSKISK